MSTIAFSTEQEPPRKLIANWSLVFLLATVTMLSHVGGFIELNRLGLKDALTHVSLVWLTRLAMAAIMLALIELGRQQLARTGLQAWQRVGALIVMCTFVGTSLDTLVTLITLGIDGRGGLQGSQFRFMLFWNLCYVSLLVVSDEYAAQARRVAAALQATELSRLGTEREAATAQLQLLQAQVEPHFLFNALANVRRLMHLDPVAARAMLGDLLQYLEAALPAIREVETTLGQEIDLVRAFLAVHQVRMGPRLVVEIDVPHALHAAKIPSMSLMTLAENALKHGLQPLVGGGMIRLSATLKPSTDAGPPQLMLTVADTGRGMGSGLGGGTGLSNLRSRLKSMHGASSALSLAMNDPRGVIVTISLPAPLQIPALQAST